MTLIHAFRTGKKPGGSVSGILDRIQHELEELRINYESTKARFTSKVGKLKEESEVSQTQTRTQATPRTLLQTAPCISNVH